MYIFVVVVSFSKKVSETSNKNFHHYIEKTRLVKQKNVKLHYYIAV